MTEPFIDTMPTFAELLEDLFRRRRRPDGRRYSLRDVAIAMSSATNPVQISHQYLSMLLRGEQRNPTLEVIEGLCLFFDVPPAYFFPRLQQRPHQPLPPPAPDRGR